MKTQRLILAILLATVSVSTLAGCHHFRKNNCDECGDNGRGRGRGAGSGPAYDYPFPLGQVTDAHWETQQTNAEASDFVFYDHEFVGSTDKLAPGAKKHLMQVALRLEHVPFPVVIEQSQHNRTPELDQKRRKMIVEQLARLGVENVEKRVVVAGALAPGITSIEAERAYQEAINGDYGGFGRRFGGFGGFFR
ncbi:MAG: hypothetical protein MI757_18750 [Pirellulales bacterium]|nr:hypothetical protein [Pirellulales bacterium]